MTSGRGIPGRPSAFWNSGGQPWGPARPPAPWHPLLESVCASSFPCLSLHPGTPLSVQTRVKGKGANLFLSFFGAPRRELIPTPPVFPPQIPEPGESATFRQAASRLTRDRAPAGPGRARPGRWQRCGHPPVAPPAERQACFLISVLEDLTQHREERTRPNGR